MPYNLLLLPLIGGFLFVHLTHYFRFAAQRMDGYRLLFQAAIAGVALAIAGRGIDLLIDLTPPGPALRNLWAFVFAVPVFGDERAFPAARTGFRLRREPIRWPG